MSVARDLSFKHVDRSAPKMTTRQYHSKSPSTLVECMTGMVQTDGTNSAGGNIPGEVKYKRSHHSLRADQIGMQAPASTIGTIAKGFGML